jgi:hypothetical protein
MTKYLNSGQLFLTVMLAVLAAIIVGYMLVQAMQHRIWERRWKLCLAQAAEILAGVKAEFPHCAGVMCAITTEPNLRPANVQYRDLPFEDVLDYLDRVDAQMTPVFSMAGSREKELGNTKFWTEVDSWGATQGGVGYADGYAVQTGEIMDNAANRRNVGNQGQAFRRAYGAGWIANQVPKMPGTGKGFEKRAGADALQYIRQDMEASFTSFDQTATADTGGANGGSLMAGVRKLVDVNNKYAGANVAVVGAPSDIHYAPAAACVAEGTALADGFSLDFLENSLLALRQSTNRKLTYLYLCGLGLRKAVTGLVKPGAIIGGPGSVPGQLTMFTQELKDSKLGRSIDVIYSDYGTLMVKETDFIGTTTTDSNGNVTATRANRVALNKPNYGLILNTEKVGVRFGVNFQKGELADDGGSQPKYVRSYASLLIKNPVAFGFQAFS